MKLKMTQPLYSFIRPGRLHAAPIVGPFFNNTSCFDGNVYQHQLRPGEEFLVHSAGVFVPDGVCAVLRLRCGGFSYLEIPTELCRLQIPGDRGFRLSLPLVLQSRGFLFDATLIIAPDCIGLVEGARLGVVLFGELTQEVS